MIRKFQAKTLKIKITRSNIIFKKVIKIYFNIKIQRRLNKIHKTKIKDLICRTAFRVLSCKL